jgi:hypothetical protein
MRRSTFLLGSAVLLFWTGAPCRAQGAAHPASTVKNKASGLQFVAVAPCRVMDTRKTDGPLGGPFVGGGTTRMIPIPAGACGIPGNVSAYSLNFTVVPREGELTYLTVWPAGQTQPFVSTLNSPDGLAIANAAIVRAGADGAINAFATDDTDLVVDINGYFVPPGANTLQFYMLAPCRVIDTRNETGAFGAPSIAGGSSRSFPIPSSPCGVPANAAAYAFNVTVVPMGALAYLTAWPTGQTQPLASTLNSFDGAVLANAAIVRAGTKGEASFYARDTTDLVVDIDGYFAPPGPGGLNFYTVSPCRLVDTRNPDGARGGPILSAGKTRSFLLSETSCGLPGSPEGQAYSLNMTVVPQSTLAYLTTWPTGVPQPVVSTLNAVNGQVVANDAIVPVDGAGSIDVFAESDTHIVIDTNGYFGNPSGKGKNHLSPGSALATVTFEAHNEGVEIYGDSNLVSVTIDRFGIRYQAKGASTAQTIPWAQVSGWQANSFTTRSPSRAGDGDFGIGIYQNERYISFRTRSGRDYIAAVNVLRALAADKRRPGMGT